MVGVSCCGGVPEVSAPGEVGSGVTSGVAGGRPRFFAGKPVAAGRPGLGGGWLKKVSHGAHHPILAALRASSLAHGWA